MLLAIDVGNTNIVLGLFESGPVSQSPGAVPARPAPPIDHWRMRTDAAMTADELALTVRGLLGSHADAVTGVAALSTVPAVLRELREMLRRYWSACPQVVIEPGVKTGVPLHVDNPKEVGSDRVINTLAAHHLYPGGSIVVDFGTSTSFDVVSARGEFLGGALAPGIEISVEALSSRAAALRKVELQRPPGVIGKNTIEALQSGILFGFAGQVDGMVDRILRDWPGGDPGAIAVIATGGLAPLVIAESRAITTHEEFLTLIGLRLAFDRALTSRRRRPKSAESA